MNHYSTDLTDNRWQVIEKCLDEQVRKSKYPLRNIVNAICFLLKRCVSRGFVPSFSHFTTSFTTISRNGRTKAFLMNCFFKSQSINKISIGTKPDMAEIQIKLKKFITFGVVPSNMEFLSEMIDIYLGLRAKCHGCNYREVAN